MESARRDLSISAINFFCPLLTPVTPTTPLGGPLKTCKSQRSSAPSSTPTSTSQRAIDRRRRKFLGRAARTRLLPRDRRVAAARERGGGRSSTCMAAACARAARVTSTRGGQRAGREARRVASAEKRVARRAHRWFNDFEHGPAYLQRSALPERPPAEDCHRE